MIGSRIKEYRLKRDLKVKQLAEIIGISQGSLSDIENEKTKPSSDTISALVGNTDINPLWLLTGEGAMTLSRIFVFKGRILDDIDPELTPMDIKSRYSADYPELEDADIEGPTIKQSTEVYEFKARQPEMIAESMPLYTDRELAEIIDILQKDLPEAKGAILKILKYRKGLKEGIQDLMEIDKPLNGEG